MDDQATSLDTIIAIIKRRFWYFLLPILLVIGLSATVVFSLPAVYRSTGTILIEQQGLPADLVRSTVTSYADERIAVIRQRVMTAENLIAIMDKHGLYPDLRSGADESAALLQMKTDVAMEMESADLIDPRSGRPVSATISFSVSFDAASPEIAQAVASDIVELYLAENLKERQEVTKEASRFLEQEANRLADEIAALEGKLADFKTASGASLPEMMSSNLESIQRVNDRLRDIDQSINSLTESSILLEGELARTSPFSQTSAVGWDGQRVVDPASQLKILESQAVALSARYSAQHPDRIKVERELRALRDSLKGQDLTSTPAESDNPAYTQIRARIIANSTELDALKKTRQEVESQLADYEDRVTQAPIVEQQYLGMTRDYQAALDRYRDVKSKLMEAKLAESLESESKGERFTLIDPPRLSSEPIKPNRPAMLFLGVVLAIGSGFGTVTLRQAFDRGIYGARALASITGSPPLAIIPFIDSGIAGNRQKLRLLLSIGLIIVAIIVAVIAYLLIFLPSPTVG